MTSSHSQRLKVPVHWIDPVTIASGTLLTPDTAQQARRLAGLAYLLFALGCLFGITALIGVIINHTHLHKTNGTYCYSHLLWLIIAFWVLFAALVFIVALWPSVAATTIATAALGFWAASGLIGAWFLFTKRPMPGLPVSGRSQNL